VQSKLMKMQVLSSHRQIGINQSQEGISRGRQPVGRAIGGEVEEERREGWGSGEEPQNHRNMKPEPDSVRNVEWERHLHSEQVRQQQHRENG
jgi:hypothetical protein